MSVTTLAGTALLACCLAVAPEPPRQWRVLELVFQAAEPAPSQARGVRLDAIFTGPAGQRFDVPGFWDGEATWRVRFAPPEPGEWHYRTRAVEAATVVLQPLYDSGLVKGGEPARVVEVPVQPADELRLIVDDAGDGSGYDHADWADAAFVDAAGQVAWLDELTPLSARQGHGELGLRTNVPGHPLRIGERTYARGLGTHARGELRYRVPDGATLFRAEIGIDAVVGEKGTVRFQVATAHLAAAREGLRDPGLDGREGRFTVLPAEGANPLHRHGGILRVSADRHHLTYADGTPFFWLGDTWWFCPSDLMPLDRAVGPDPEPLFRKVVRTRAEQGFTVVHMAFLGSLGGEDPFHSPTGSPNLSPTYWQAVDRYLDYANEQGLLPAIGVGWTGNPLGEAEWRVLWRHLIARYNGHAVTWLVCGEYNVKDAESRVERTLAVGAFIKATDPYQRAMTIHPWYYGGDKRQAWSQPWYDFIMLQGGHGTLPPLSLYREAAEAEPPRPVLEAECRYEGIHEFRDAAVREAACRAIQAGSFGFSYGSQGLWYPTQSPDDHRFDNWGRTTPWWEALQRPGAAQLGHLRRALESVEWWRLEPVAEAVEVVATDADSGPLTVVGDLVDRFPSAVAAGALWARIDTLGAGPTSRAIHLHPATRDAATLRYPPLRVPPLQAGQQALLVLAYALHPQARLDDPANPSDGVTFSVQLDGETVFRDHSHSHDWRYQAIPLPADREVSVTLATAGGANVSWDHALFRQPVVVLAGGPEPRRALYTGPCPGDVLVRADGERLFTCYVPAQSQVARYRLRGASPGAAYRTTWWDLRRGESHSLELTAAGDGLLLPEAPDADDWFLIVARR